MKLTSLLRSLLSCAALTLVAAAPAQAGVLYNTHYTITLNAGSLGVTGIIKYEDLANGGGASWPDAIGGDPEGSVTTTIDQVFPTTTPRTSALLLGLSYDGYYGPDNFGESGPPQGATKHLVMFMNTDAANAVGAQDFNSVFTGFDEDTVISWLEVVTILGVDGPQGVGQTVFDENSALLDGFAQAVKSFVTNDTSVSAWFDIPADQNVQGGFSVVSFSDGSQVGTGFVTQTQQEVTNVPEPWPLALVGIGLLAMAGHRRRAVSRG